MGVGSLAVTKKRTFFNKMAHFFNKKLKKAEKLKKKLQNGTFYCVFFVKIAHPIQKHHPMLKWVV